MLKKISDFLKKKRKTLLISALLTLLAFFDIFCVAMSNIVYRNFGYISASQLIFHLQLPINNLRESGFDRDFQILIRQFLLAVIPLYVTLFAVIEFISRSKYSRILYNILIIILSVCTIFSIETVCERIPVANLKHIFFRSHMIDNNFCDVKAPDIKFANRRNCVLIIAESLEDSFALPEAVGTNYIPQLDALKKQNISFSRRYDVSGSGWTIAGLVNIFYGIPQLTMHGPSEANERNRRSWSCLSLFKILQQKGYNCTYMQGGDMEFAGKFRLFLPTPEVKIISYEKLKNDPEHLNNPSPHSWGVADKVLFRHIRGELDRLAQKDEPFFLCCLTLDTHFPKGYLPPEDSVCSEDEYFPRVLQLMDKRICDLVKYIQEQKYAENTTIIIVGDHISMPNQLRNELDKYNGDGGPCGRRRAYNCFINPARKRENSSERKYSAFDLMPTILHAMGAEWGSDRMNLGVSLFGNTPTLLEKYGIVQYQKQSLMYSPKYVELIKMH